MSRRTFIGTAAGAVAGLCLWGRAAGAARTARGDLTPVALGHLTSYDRRTIRVALEDLLQSLGGLGDLVRPGDTVGIKINTTGGSTYATNYQSWTGKTPGETYWTHPEILRAIGELARDAGAGRIFVLEAADDTSAVPLFGYGTIIDALGATFIDLNLKSPYAGYATRSVGPDPFIYPEFVQNGVLDEIDCCISLAKSKWHNGAGVTHGLKNLVGTLPVPSGLYNAGQHFRIGLHQHDELDGVRDSNLRRIILDLARATPIHLVINDAISTVRGGEGPWGPPGSLVPVDFGKLVVAKDPVAADVVATWALGEDPMAADFAEPFSGGINYLRLAGDLGMGTSDLADIDLREGTYHVGAEADPRDNAPLNFHGYPIPFREEATFAFTLKESGYVSLEILDLIGRRVARVVARSFPAGVNKVSWKARLPAGTYVAVLRHPGGTASCQVVLVN
jgi:uncharacterized protein (DUF362 family)